MTSAPPKRANSFRGRPGSYLADRLRSDWLKALGRRSDWQTFDLELAPLVQEDLEVRCYGWLSRLARSDDGVHDEAKVMWLEPKELPEGCSALAEKLINDGRLRVKDVWVRARVLFDNGQLSAAQRGPRLSPRGRGARFADVVAGGVQPGEAARDPAAGTRATAGARDGAFCDRAPCAQRPACRSRSSRVAR
jgi:hypothetical protein